VKGEAGVSLTHYFPSCRSNPPNQGAGSAIFGAPFYPKFMVFRSFAPHFTHLSAAPGLLKPKPSSEVMHKEPRMLDFNQSHRQGMDKDLERSSATIMVVLATLVVATIMQIGAWDKYSLDVIPLLLKEMVGATSPQDWEDKAKMCWELKKWDCVEYEYTKSAQNDRGQYVRLGHYQMRRLKFDKAANSFRIFFKGGGEDIEAAKAYAKALAETNQFDESSKYFNLVLDTRPESLQIPVVLDFVKLLMKNEKYEHARRLIEDVRKQNPAGSQFMDSEYKQIKKLMTAAR